MQIGAFSDRFQKRWRMLCFEKEGSYQKRPIFLLIAYERTD